MSKILQEYVHLLIESKTDIRLSKWYSCDIHINNESNLEPEKLKNILLIFENLKINKKIDKWYFLFEGDRMTFRLYVPKTKSKKFPENIKNIIINKANKNGLKTVDNSFGVWEEKKSKMFNKDVMEAFGNIMSNITSLRIKKLKNINTFENYRTMERINHCIFNILCGDSRNKKSEIYFLLQRIAERNDDKFDDSFGE